MYRKPLACIVSVSMALGGCATASKDIATAPVSPLIYQSYDCTQIAAEALRIQGRITELGGRLDQAAENDRAITAAGIILFWPALFFLGGTKQQEAEYSRLKGEYEALQQASIERKCATAPQQAAASTIDTSTGASPDAAIATEGQVARGTPHAQAPVQVGARVDAPDIRVGDRWKYVVTDGFTAQKGVAIVEVVRVEPNRIHTQSVQAPGAGLDLPVSAGGRSEIWDRHWNLIRDGSIEYSPSYPLLKFPLHAGIGWSGRVKFVDGANLEVMHNVTAQVVGWERITVPAGRFDAVRINLRGSRQVSGGGFLPGAGIINDTYWYSPAIRQFVMKEVNHTASGNVFGSSADAAAVSQRKERWELVEFRAG